MHDTAPDGLENVSDSRLTDVLHIGVLTRLLHPDLVDEVIGDCGRKEQRSRLLPARVVLYYVLCLCLFCADGYEEVMRRMVTGLRPLHHWKKTWQVPSTGAISQARKRLGEEPLRALFERVAVPCAGRGIAGSRFHGRRVMAIDGTLFQTPDTASNEQAFGRPTNDTSAGPYPQARVVAIIECASRAIVDARIGSYYTGERTLAHDLLHSDRLTEAIVLADRGFYSYHLLKQAKERDVDILWRVSNNLRLHVEQALPDGSFIAFVIDPAKRKNKNLNDEDRIRVRIVEYEIQGRSSSAEMFCLMTSLLDPEEAPAVELAALYQERWEIEIGFGEIKRQLRRQGTPVRSKSADLVRQELWATLLLHYAVRSFIVEASAETEHDPDRFSFLRAVRITRRSVSDRASFSPSPSHATDT